MSQEGGVQTVISMMKTQPIWADPCAASVAPMRLVRLSQAASYDAADARLRHAPRHEGAKRPGAGVPSRHEQRVQVEQGRSVFSDVDILDVFEGTDPIAQTAQNPVVQNGVSGPYTWRQPV